MAKTHLCVNVFVCTDQPGIQKEFPDVAEEKVFFCYAELQYQPASVASYLICAELDRCDANKF